MNWAKENKFLTGFLVVLVLAAGALIFLVLGAKGKLEEATSRYSQQSSEYNRLRNLAPHPNQKNLEAFRQQKEEAMRVISEFQTDLGKKEIPLVPMEPAEFQDKLKAAVTAVRAKAAEANVKLPEKFYLGFDRYETQPPERNATAALGRQLKVIEWVVTQLIEKRVAIIGNLARPELPEEGNRAGARGPQPQPGRGGDNRGGRGGSDRGGDRGPAKADLVTYQSFDVQFACKQPNLAGILNAIIGPGAPQFLVPRAIRIKNEKTEGPARTAEAGAAAPPPPPPPDAPKPPEGTVTISHIVGEEMVEASIRLDIVNFAKPAAPTAAK